MGKKDPDSSLFGYFPLLSKQCGHNGRVFCTLLCRKSWDGFPFEVENKTDVPLMIPDPDLFDELILSPVGC
jgi:hypothetical protein